MENKHAGPGTFDGIVPGKISEAILVTVFISHFFGLHGTFYGRNDNKQTKQQSQRANHRIDSFISLEKRNQYDRNQHRSR
jgi:hypothetical protein